MSDHNPARIADDDLLASLGYKPEFTRYEFLEFTVC